MPYQNALAELKGVLAQVRKSDAEIQEMIANRDGVYSRYQEIFAAQNLDQLTKEDFHGFLLFKNNHHWDGIHRQVNSITADMLKLRGALKLLVDESQDIRHRLDKLVPRKGDGKIPGLGRAIITPILHVMYPTKYGVWNTTSMAGLQSLEIWPAFKHGAPFSERYVLVNELLLKLADGLGIDLWQLDALWWRVKRPIGADGPPPPPDPQDTAHLFGLEKHLHEFLVANWSKIDLGHHWNLFEEDGEVAGIEYPCPNVGKIDILATAKTGNQWLVIELKRAQTSDETVGQVLRYMGYVRRQLAKPGETVHGLIIAHDVDAKLLYALDSLPNVELMQYSVNFQLRKHSDSAAKTPAD